MSDDSMSDVDRNTDIESVEDPATEDEVMSEQEEDDDEEEYSQPQIQVQQRSHQDTDSDANDSDENVSEDADFEIDESVAEKEDVVMQNHDAESSDEQEQEQEQDDEDDDDDDEDAEVEEEEDDDDDDDDEMPTRRSRVGATSVRRQTKRNDIEDYEVNPELYGLRRSVRRATKPSTSWVEDDDSDNSDNGDDSSGSNKRGKKRTATRVVKRGSVSSNSSPAASESEAEDSDDSEVYERKKATKKQRVSRTKARSSRPSLDASFAEAVRISSRKATRITNYNEEDSDEDMEEDMAYELAKQADYNSGPRVDVFLDYRYKEGLDPESTSLSAENLEFYVKWAGMSHYHASWETAESLAQFKAQKKMANYIGKLRLRMDARMGCSRDEIENMDIELERDRAALEEYVIVERVIAQRQGDEGREYLVKWKRLQYDSCTWEAEELVKKIGQQQIDDFKKRNSRNQVSDSNESNVKTRRRFEKMTEQPDYIKGGELRAFQLQGLNFLAYNWCLNRNVILADEMGLGKTVQTVSFLNWLQHSRRQYGPFLVVVPLSTVPAWADTFDKWAPEMNYLVYIGNKEARSTIREHEFWTDTSQRRTKFNVLITTYELVSMDKDDLGQMKWQFLAVDEAHRLKNQSASLYTILDRFKTGNRLLITGTPIQNNMAELRSLFEFLNPGLLDFIPDIDITTASEKAEETKITIDQIQKATAPYLLRRVKQSVEKDMPGKTEKIIRVELSDEQAYYYKNIITRNYEALNKAQNDSKHQHSLLNIVMELKKASNHPYIFQGAAERITGNSDDRQIQLRSIVMSSGKMVLLDKLLLKLKQDKHRVLIFSQMVSMLDVISQYLQLRGLSFQRIDGTIPSNARRAAIDHFNQPDSTDFCFLLSTRAGGLGINLMTADTVILFDSDWNPQADLQAMARAHRIGQKNHVMVYRLVSKDTIEEEILERARDKMILEHLIMSMGESKDRYEGKLNTNISKTSSAELSRLLKARAKKMFEANDNQKKLEELNIDDMLTHAEDHDTNVGTAMTADGGKAFLSQFEVTDVATNFNDPDWDSIIPQADLEAIKEEQARKKHEEFLQEQIALNSKRKRNTEVNARDERKAKRRARERVSDSSESESDAPAAPVVKWGEKQIRNLYKSIGRYGHLDEMYDKIIADAKLEKFDQEIIRKTLKEMEELGSAALQEHQAKVAANPTPANQKKAVLFDYGPVTKINAEVLLKRPEQLRILRELVKACEDPMKFRIDDAKSAPSTWTCDWTPKDDAMFCVGIVRHGFGSWVPIRDDLDLGLKDKFFLEEHRVDKKDGKEKPVNGEEAAASGTNNGTPNGVGKRGKNYGKAPGSIHLVRRAEYLLGLLEEKYHHEKQKEIEKAERVRKRRAGHKNTTGSRDVSNSPAIRAKKPATPNAGEAKPREGIMKKKPKMKMKTPSTDSIPKIVPKKLIQTTLTGKPRPDLGSGNSTPLPRIKKKKKIPVEGEKENGTPIKRKENNKPVLFSIIHKLRELEDAVKNKAGGKEAAANIRNRLTDVGDAIEKMGLSSTKKDEAWKSIPSLISLAMPIENLRNIYNKINERRKSDAGNGTPARPTPNGTPSRSTPIGTPSRPTPNGTPVPTSK